MKHHHQKRFRCVGVAYLNPSSYYDSHEKIGDDTSYGHHQALNHSHTGVEAQHKEQVMHETWMKFHHKIAYGSRGKGYHDQKRHCRQCVADNKC